MAKELAAGKMYRPTAVVNGLAADIYVVEQYNHRVSKYSTTPPSFDFILDVTWGTNNDGTTGGPGRAIADDDEFFNFPTGIAVGDSGAALFVSDTLNNRVRVLNIANGNFIDSIGTPGTGDDELYRPAHLDVDPVNNRLAIADSFNSRVSVYSSTTTFAFQGIATPPAEGFHTPYGVKHNTNQAKFHYSDVIRGKLYSYLSSDGITPTTPTTIGTPGTDPAVPNEIFFPGSASGGTGVAADTWLTDTRNNKIKEFTSTGVISDRLTGAGTGDAQFYHPEYTMGFSTGGTDYLLVCNTLNNRIEVFDRATDIFQNNFGSP